MFDVDEFKRNLNSVNTQTRFYQYILETIPPIVPEMQAWAILPFKAETKQLILLFENTRNYDFFPSAKYLSYKEGFEGLAILKKEAVIEDDFRVAVEEHKVKFLCQPNSGCSSALVIPIIQSERIVGALSLYFVGPIQVPQKYLSEVASFAKQIAYPMEELIRSGFVEEQSRVTDRTLRNIDTIVGNFSAISAGANWRASLDMILHSIRAVIDYSASGVFSYLPNESRIKVEAQMHLNMDRFKRLEFDLAFNPIIDILSNRSEYLEEKHPTKLQQLGDFHSAVGICIACGKGHDVALLLMHEQSFRYNRFHVEYLKRFAPLFSLVCEKKEAELSLETTQAKVMAGELTPMMMHEIRNLLNYSMNQAGRFQEFLIAHWDGLSHLLERPEELQDYRLMVDSMIEGQKNTKQLLDRYLEMTGQSKSPEQRQKIDLNETIRKVASLLLSEAKDKGVLLKTELPANLPKVSTDSNKLQRILMNLILNAIQVLSKGKEIRVSTSYDPGDTKLPLRIQVKDNGPGISTHHLEKIFQPYFTTKKGGTGLGLPVCKQFAREIGGTLQVDSILHRGATFTVCLPIKLEVLGD